MIKLSNRHILSGSKSSKVLIVGAHGVGKSAILQRFLSGDFSDKKSTSTLGTELYLKDEVFGGEKTTLHIWDCAGHQRFRPIIQHLYDDVKGVVLCYDVTSHKSFQELAYWHNEILRAIPEATMVMIGNKLDLSDDVKISPEDGLKQCKEWNIQHLNVSAKTGQGCDKVVALLLSQIQKATSYIQ